MRAILVILSIFCGLAVTSDSPIVVCYWGAWANTRPSIGRFGVSDLPTNLCTTIIYSFLELNADGELILPEENIVEGKSNTLEDFRKLRESNNNLTLLAAIGGWNEGSEDFSAVAKNDTTRAIFVSNIVNFIQTHGLQGLDVDWEYPGRREGSNETDKASFVWLLRDLKNAFQPYGWLLTAAVSVTQSTIDLSYDVPRINEILDYIHLMSYDFYGAWDPMTGLNAPLYPQSEDDDAQHFNVDAAINVWIKNGADASKLVVGLAAYGRTFNLVSLEETGIGAPANGSGAPGLYTAEAGFLSYYEICMHQQSNNWNITNVDDLYVFGNSDHFWVGYDNERTIYRKGQHANQKDLPGIMFWAVDLDDFGKRCSSTDYPLIRQGIEGYKNSAVNLLSKSLLVLLSVTISFKIML